MKILTLAMWFVLASTQSDTTPLVEASKDAKAKRKSSTTKVITNADVKKSKGKLIERPASEAKPDPTPGPTSAEKHEAERKARIEREAKIAAAEKLVAELEKALEKIEQAYYDENDLDRRDKVIVKQFDEAKKQLDDAKKALEDLLH